ncbi:MAG: hypothetical protein WBQ85_07895 [Candidatus Sulfotelmatobacter sp.]
MATKKLTSEEIREAVIDNGRALRIVALLGLILGTLVCSAMAQDITIRLVDFRNGKPLRGRMVDVMYAGSNHHVQRFPFKTNDEGVARFSVPSPPPVDIWFSASAWLCGAGRSSFHPDDLNLHGAVQQGECKLGKSVAQPQVRPGEVILFARPAPWWAPIWGHILGS